MSCFATDLLPMSQFKMYIFEMQYYLNPEDVYGWVYLSVIISRVICTAMQGENENVVGRAIVTEYQGIVVYSLYGYV